MSRAALCYLVIATAAAGNSSAIGLTVSNPNPQIGQLVTFEITGQSGDVEAHWDFGGAGCAPFVQTETCEPIYTDCLDTTYKYASAGAKTVTVTAYDPDTGATIGSAMVNLTVQASGSCGGGPGNPTEYKLIASDALGDEFFGGAVAVSGRNVVVGSQADDSNGGAYSGSAFIYQPDSGGNWANYTETKLPSPVSGPTQFFGYAVAAEGGTVAVSANKSSACGPLSEVGAVYIYRDTSASGNWSSYSETLICPSASPSSEMSFGCSMALRGRVLVVGAREDPSNGANAGSVYLFQDISAAGDWSMVTETKILASDGEAEDWFGHSVSLTDGAIAVGAYGTDDNGSYSGSVYILLDISPPQNWSSIWETQIIASDGAANDWFGRDVAIQGGTLVVGALHDYDGGHLSGSVYVYQDLSVGGDWTAYSETKILPSDGTDFDNFGQSVDIDETQLIVGAHKHGSSSGAAYLFVDTSADGDWSAYDEVKLVPSDSNAGDEFGYSVAIDGIATAVGSPLDTNEGGIQAGAAYLYVQPVWILFEDGFESGDTSAWSSTVP
jgi:hypothetical protein